MRKERKKERKKEAIRTKLKEYKERKKLMKDESSTGTYVGKKRNEWLRKRQKKERKKERKRRSYENELKRMLKEKKVIKYERWKRNM